MPRHISTSVEGYIPPLLLKILLSNPSSLPSSLYTYIFPRHFIKLIDRYLKTKSSEKGCRFKKFDCTFRKKSLSLVKNEAPFREFETRFSYNVARKKRKFTRLQIVSRSGSAGERKAGHNPREGNKSEARGQYPRGQAREKLSTSLVTWVTVSRNALNFMTMQREY